MFFLNKKWGIIFTIIALLIGLSRVIIGVHYPFDILGGFVVGILVGLFFIKIFRKI
jgi:undecaprenyl-diphosphatase